MNLITSLRNFNLSSPAIIDQTNTFTYGELIELIEKCTMYFVKQKCHRVVIKRDDDVLLAALFLGCLNAGCSPLLVSNKHQSDVLKSIIDRFKPDLIIDNELKLSNIEILKPSTADNFDNSNFYLCSSGTTGHLKIVKHRSSSLLFTGLQFNSIRQIKQDDIFFSSAKLTHAFGLGNSLSIPLSNGACSVLFPGEPTTNAVQEILNKYHPTVLCGVPRHIISFNSLGIHDGVRLIVSAGEQLPPVVKKKASLKFNCDIVDAIGSTEVLGFFLSANADGKLEKIPGCYYEEDIIDNHIITLRVKSDYSSPGYLNELEFSKGWIPTSDLFVKIDEKYEFIGRCRDRVKLNGFHVYLNEIDDAVKSLEGIDDCYSSAALTDNFKTRLHLNVVSSLNYREISKKLQSLSSLYRIPYVIKVVHTVPRTISGKVQRYI